MAHEMNGRFFIEIELPAPIQHVGELMKVIAKRWPGARIDLNHPGGWQVICRPEHQKGTHHDSHGRASPPPERTDSGSADQ